MKKTECAESEKMREELKECMEAKAVFKNSNFLLNEYIYGRLKLLKIGISIKY